MMMMMMMGFVLPQALYCAGSSMFTYTVLPQAMTLLASAGHAWFKDLELCITRQGASAIRVWTKTYILKHHTSRHMWQHRVQFQFNLKYLQGDCLHAIIVLPHKSYASERSCSAESAHFA